MNRRQLVRGLATSGAAWLITACGLPRASDSASPVQATLPIATQPRASAVPYPSALPGSEEPMQIRYTRTGGLKPPRDREVLEIGADGSFTLWRSIAAATQPATAIGSFAGKAPEYAALLRLAKAAAAAGELSIRPAPDSPVESIQVGDVKARLGIYDQPEAPWGPFIERMRMLLGELTSMPRAALALELDQDGMAARLVQHGSDPLTLDLSDLTVRAVLWEGSNKQGDWWARGAAGPQSVEATPGWTYELPFGHGFTIGAQQRVAAYVTCAAFDGTKKVPVALSSARA